MIQSHLHAIYRIIAYHPQPLPLLLLLLLLWLLLQRLLLLLSMLLLVVHLVVMVPDQASAVWPHQKRYCGQNSLMRIFRVLLCFVEA